MIRIERDADLGSWELITRTSTNLNTELKELRFTKLIVLNDRECVPDLPSRLDTNKFTGTVFHAKEIGKRHDGIIKDGNIKNITVVGANKSAFEIAANMGLAGKKVNWLIREGGGSRHEDRQPPRRQGARHERNDSSSCLFAIYKLLCA